MLAPGRPRIIRYGGLGAAATPSAHAESGHSAIQAPTPPLRRRLADLRMSSMPGGASAAPFAGRWHAQEYPRGRCVRRPALRRDRHRHGGGRRHVRPPARSVRQAGPVARTRRLPAARARQLGLHRGVRQGQVPGAGVLARPARPRVPAGGQLLRRRQHQVLRCGAVPAAPAGLRRAAPPRRDLAGVADRLRRSGAVLHPGRAPLPRARPARRGPDGGSRQRGLPVSAGAARTADPAAQRRPGEAGPAPVPPADRRAADAGRARPGHPRQRVHPLRPGGRLPLPGGRQGRRPGDLRRSGAASTTTSRWSPTRTSRGWRPTEAGGPSRRSSPRSGTPTEAWRRCASAPTSWWSPRAR